MVVHNRVGMYVPDGVLPHLKTLSLREVTWSRPSVGVSDRAKMMALYVFGMAIGLGNCCGVLVSPRGSMYPELKFGERWPE